MRCHIVIVNAVYPPEPVVSAQMGRDLSDYLVQNGAQVTVLCPYPTRPLGVAYSNYPPIPVAKEEVEGKVKVVRLPSFTAPQSRLLARMRESWSFGRQACHYLAQHLPDVDVVYANTWPLLSQTLLARYCAGRNVPLVWHIQDLYPESLLNKLPDYVSKVIAKPLTALDQWNVRQAQHIVVISENMRQVYLTQRGLPPEKITVLLNWVDEQRFSVLPERAKACAHYQIPKDRFTFLYLGNIGPVAGVELLIEAFHAAQLAHAQLVIAGDGSSKAACVALAERLAVSGVRFVSDPNAGNVPMLQSLGHVCLLPLRKGAGMSSIPSKLMAYLLSAKPVLATVDAESDTARAVSEAQCGWVGEPENIKSLAMKMAQVAGLPPAVLVAMGQRGRSYGLAHFSKATGVRKLANIILGARESNRDEGSSD